MDDAARHDVIEIDAEKMSGTPVFRGTRVPINHLFDYLTGGHSIETFLNHFPTVSRSQVMELFELTRSKIPMDAIRDEPHPELV